jgi:hypothetical protein
MVNEQSESTHSYPGTRPTGYSLAPPRRNGAGTAALVIGVLSLVLAVLVLFSWFAILLGPIAIILGVIGVRRVTRGEADNRGSAVAGIATGLVSLLLVVAFGFRIAQIVSGNTDDFRRFGTCMRQADNDNEFGDCFQELSDSL